MKNLKSLLEVLLILGVSIGCSNDSDIVEKRLCCVNVCSDKPTLEGTWRLTGYRNVSTGELESDPDPDGKGVVFTFKDNEKEGTIEGHTFANTIFGKYSLGEQCRYKILEFGGTKVGEPGWSSKAWLLALAEGNYQRTGNDLTLFRDKGNNVWEGMVFKKQ